MDWSEFDEMADNVAEATVLSLSDRRTANMLARSLLGANETQQTIDNFEDSLWRRRQALVRATPPDGGPNGKIQE